MQLLNIHFRHIQSAIVLTTAYSFLLSQLGDLLEYPSIVCNFLKMCCRKCSYTNTSIHISISYELQLILTMRKGPERFVSFERSLNPFPRMEAVFKLCNSEPPWAQAQWILLSWDAQSFKPPQGTFLHPSGRFHESMALPNDSLGTFCIFFPLVTHDSCKV